jgi:dTDP-3-amino-2,3,6-trideoxy-4-keto-D-glucose/dTDP-3-amino-3,4,6-trideoxy-alpha-D-glucose/dTDP-2,6-dideoxy-D-kanosamine transaminase
MLLLNDPVRRYRARAEFYEQAFVDALNSGRIVLGPHVSGFEAEFADYCGVPRAVSVANGTDGLVLALRALGAGPDRSIWSVANAGFYTATAARLIGAELNFFDIDPNTHVAPASLQLPESARGQVLVLTHLYGNPVPPDVFAEGRRLGMLILEDCSQAHGASVSGKRVGGLGDVGVFSLYPTKNLGAFGDGGIIVSRSDEIADHVLRLRTYGWSSKYTVASPFGMNSRLDEVQAAMLRISLSKLENWNAVRREIVEQYADAVRGRARMVTRFDRDAVAHLAVLELDDREALRAALAQRQIGTDIHYPIPDHRQEVLAHEAGRFAPLPVTEKASSRILSLPLYPELTKTEVERVVSALQESLP